MLAFVHVEKAAGSSVHEILKRWYGGRYCPVERWRLDDPVFTAADLRRLRLLYPRLQALGGHWIMPWSDIERACPGMRWWSLLREPVVRCASHYQYQVQEMGRTVPFERWISDPHYQNFQTRKLVGSDDAEAAIRLLEERFLFVGPSERFEECLLVLRRLAGLEQRPLVLARENVSRSDAIKDELLDDPVRRARLEEANQADRRVYAHVRDVLYPRHRAAYGPGLDDDLVALRAAPTPGAPLHVRAAELKRYALYKPAVWLSRRLARPRGAELPG